MRVFDYLQDEIRDVKEIIILSNEECELIYNNETVKRKIYEFRFLDIPNNSNMINSNNYYER